MAGGAGGDVLARRYVELAMRGQGDISKALKSIREELIRAKQAGSLLSKSLRDGTYQRAANDLAAIRKQYEAMYKAARLQDLIAEHGRFGGTLRHLEERMAGVTRTAAWGFGLLTATTLGWVRAGMQGTVEQYQLEYGFQRLSRAIAGAFKPTIDAATNGIHKLANWFQGLSGEQQDNLRKVVLWTAGLMGGVLALNLMTKAAIATQAALVSLGIVQARQAAAGAAGNNAGLLGLMGGGKWALRAGIAGLLAYGLNEATAGEGDSARDRGVVRKLGGTAKRSLDAAWDETLGRFWTTGAERDSMRARRRAEERQQWGLSYDAGALAPDKKREDLMLNQTGFQEIGASYDQVANAVMKIDTPMTKLTDAVQDLTKAIIENMPPEARLAARWLANPGG